MSNVFDESHPPSRALADDCVHCGFCLPACPTYQLWGEEMDSPRGRIHLISLGLDGEVALDRTFVEHFDACLGCMACTTACPSGVDYASLLEATRGQIERRVPRPVGEALHRDLVLTVLPRRWALRAVALVGWVHQRLGLAALTQALPGRWRALAELLPQVDLGAALRPLRRQWPTDAPRMRVGLLAGCVQSVFFREVHEATARVLVAEGCEVVVPPGAGCCGALSHHAGRDDDARRRARETIEAFADVDRVVVDAAGCGSSMKRYAQLLDDEAASDFSSRVCDVHELLDELEPRAKRHPLPLRVAYHDACHLAHGQGIRAEPRRLLRAIPGLTLVEVPEGDTCCGSAGIYNLTQPEPAAALGRAKAERIDGLDVDLVAAANPGCALQIRRHQGRPVVHPIQLLDASLRATSLAGASEGAARG